MKYIIMDFEWNSTYCKQTHSFFNEIIEIGAVMLNDKLEQEDIFRQFVKPKYSKRLTGIVKRLTHISIKDLENGLDFASAVKKFSQWAGKGDHIFMTWSMSDLHTLIDNCQVLMSSNTIPFLSNYLDLQKYCQEALKQDNSQNLGLSKAAELLKIDQSDIMLHRALGDSILTAKIFEKIYDSKRLKKHTLNANKADFYDMVTFKNIIIQNIDNPIVDKKQFRFNCKKCNLPLSLGHKAQWQFKGRYFKCALICPKCKNEYLGKVQFKITYDGLKVKRILAEASEDQADSTSQTTEEK